MERKQSSYSRKMKLQKNSLALKTCLLDKFLAAINSDLIIDFMNCS